MSNLQLAPDDQNDDSLIEVRVFSKGKPYTNWFKATLGSSLVMVFYPDDMSINASLIEPRDCLYIAGLRPLEVAGACDRKATCAPLVLQREETKKIIEERKKFLTELCRVQKYDRNEEESFVFSTQVVGAVDCGYVQDLINKQHEMGITGELAGQKVMHKLISAARMYDYISQNTLVNPPEGKRW